MDAVKKWNPVFLSTLWAVGCVFGLIILTVLSLHNHDQQLKTGEEKTLESEKQIVPVQERDSSDAAQKKSAIELAMNEKIELEQIEMRGAQIGLMFPYFNCTLEEFTGMIERAENNSALRNAFQKAKERNVVIFPNNKRFFVESGWVCVYIKATDEEIINFLLDP